MISILRTDSVLAPSGPSGSPQRHLLLYFRDGDVVLSALNGDTKWLFCVHKGVLSHYSPVFATMFDLPMGTKTNEIFDNLPVVHLHDDYADVEKFLGALYNLGCVVTTLYRSISSRHDTGCHSSALTRTHLFTSAAF